MPDEIKPETMEIDLPSGVKVTLPKDVALKEIEHRQKIKQELRTRDEELGRLKAEKDAQVSAAEKARQDAETQAAIKAGEFDKARQILEKQFNDQLASFETSTRASRLESIVRSNQFILPEAADDVASLLVSSCKLNIKTNSLEVIGQDGRPRLDSDGKPMSADALVNEYLDKRPHLKRSTSPSGSGATGTASGASKNSKVISEREYEAAMRDPYKAQPMAKAVASGEVTVK